ncbi:MAG: hypothetical protein P1Q69_02230 [Candidatus Thorarchaeota archaeon]|nr:hypothetical protein [Candidatus Thorarchaeota archaeon]
MSSSVDNYLRILKGIVTDEFIARDIVKTVIHNGQDPKLDIKRFEKRVGLPSIHREPIRESDIVLRIGNPAPYGLQAKGTTLKNQIASLLPSREDIDEYQSSLIYFLSRVLVGNLPRSSEWAINHTDLDSLSSALFILQIISTAIGNRFDWIRELHEEISGMQYTSSFETQIPRADSIEIANLPEFVSRAKRRICAIQFEPLQNVCASLSKKTTPQPISRDVIASMLKIPNAVARYRAAILELIITERYFPIYHSLGLRQRWFTTYTDIAKLAKSRLSSPGLIGRFILRDSLIRQVLHHVEPVHFEGPEIVTPGSHSFTTEQELISFRLDLFNQEKNAWDFHPWDHPSQWAEKPNIWNSRKRMWLVRNSESVEKHNVTLTKKQSQIFGVLLSNRGSPSYRRLLLGMLGDKKSNLKSRIDRLCNTGSVNVLYHPSLEYSALPEGVLVVFPNLSGKQLAYLRSWLMGAIPYLHLHWSNESGFVAMLRIPENNTGIVISFLREFLSENEIVSSEEEYVIGSIQKAETYTFTLPGRLYDSRTNSWKDPWRQR